MEVVQVFVFFAGIRQLRKTKNIVTYKLYFSTGMGIMHNEVNTNFRSQKGFAFCVLKQN